jgi:spore maturation protein CgeB
MPHEFRIAYFAHAIRSDWNNGNAHFLRGLLRCLRDCGHEVSIFEPEDGWSLTNLRTESNGEKALRDFAATYPELLVTAYSSDLLEDPDRLRSMLRGADIVILHEWNPPALAHRLSDLRDDLGYRLLFHDTHHRAISARCQIKLLGIDRFDGVITFGEVLTNIYRNELNIRRVWTLHEAADTDVFRPTSNGVTTADVVWIGNWGDEERSKEICEFLVEPAARLRGHNFTVYGVRYPPEALQALSRAGIRYCGYLPNLAGPAVYGATEVTVHIPRRHYANLMRGIPTIRVFEALACGIPLISAPWEDSENLFCKDDFQIVHNSGEMASAIAQLLSDRRAAQEQAERGLQSVLARHTCRHRAEQLTEICEELVQ